MGFIRYKQAQRANKIAKKTSKAATQAARAAEHQAAVAVAASAAQMTPEQDYPHAGRVEAA